MSLADGFSIFHTKIVHCNMLMNSAYNIKVITVNRKYQQVKDISQLGKAIQSTNII